MTLGIMQPYFFPYIGYFALIAQSHRFIVFDTVQYCRKSWMNRNRILHPSSGWQYISLPIRNQPRETPIFQTQLVDRAAACRKILGQMAHYAAHAPYDKAVRELVHHAFTRCRDDSLVEINIASLAVTCEYLGLPFTPERFSQMALPLPAIARPGEWALEIATALGADHYLNAPGGRALFQAQDFEERNIGLSFLNLPPLLYDCAPYTFEPQLSILDVLMWNHPCDVSAYLATATLDCVVPPTTK